MTKKAMDALIEAGLDLGAKIEGRGEYHGRGMSKPTCAVTADSISDMIAAAAIAGHHATADDADGVVADLRGLRIDSIGKGIVVY